MNRTVIDCGGIGLAGCKTREELLTYAAEDTFAAGTILARKTALSVSAGTVQGGTGTGTISAVALVEGPVVPMAGVYVLTCIVAVANGGVFKLVDPNGAVVAGYLPMTVGSTVATTFEAGGLTWILTDATDFIAGNYFEITVVAGTKLVPYNPAGVGGAQLPRFVLPTEQYKAAAGDKPVTVICGGDVKKERLIIDVDGTGANVTAAVIDQLRSLSGINAVPTQQLSALDNA